MPFMPTKALTPADINSLPENIRWFVMELETFADPSGIIRRNMQLEHDNRALQQMIKNLKKGDTYETGAGHID